MTCHNRDFRGFLKKLVEARGLTYEGLARKLGTPDDLLKQRVKQIDHFFNDPDDGDPRTSLSKAIEEALGVVLPATDYGWNPEKL